MILQVAVALRLHGRNKVALLYSYLFPTLFLLAFWVLYRHDAVPLVRHMGELLTVTALGGACFGLPTTLVSERERGVWRRYRLTPVPTGQLVASTLLARYVLLIVAALLQLALAMALGMPFPRHPVDLWIAFTAVAVAFLGLGLVIAMLANTVPAVQALGQCLFLPMLIVGGIAVPLASLPAWAQRLAGYLPGRYAVETLQATVTGPGLGAVRFGIAALLVIGLAGCLAGARLFRWDAQHRVGRGAYGWVAVALAAWVAVGLTADARRHAAHPPAPTRAASAAPTAAPSIEKPESAPAASGRLERVPPIEPPAKKKPPPAAAPAVQRPSRATTVPSPRRDRSGAEVAPRAGPGRSRPLTWQEVTQADIERDLNFAQLPPDSGIVTPVAEEGETPDPNQTDLLDHIRKTLPHWKPGQATDPVQRTRHYLYIAAFADVQRLTLERHIALVIFDHLRAQIPKDHLIRILYWIALYPDEGAVLGPEDLRPLRLDHALVDVAEVADRIAIYATKLLGRVLGKRSAQAADDVPLDQVEDRPAVIAPLVAGTRRRCGHDHQVEIAEHENVLSAVAPREACLAPAEITDPPAVAIELVGIESRAAPPLARSFDP